MHIECVDYSLHSEGTPCPVEDYRLVYALQEIRRFKHWHLYP